MEKLAERLQSCLKRKKNTPPSPDPLLLEIRELVSQMDAVRSLFDLTSDPNLVEGLIHEMNALTVGIATLCCKQGRKIWSVCISQMICFKKGCMENWGR